MPYLLRADNRDPLPLRFATPQDAFVYLLLISRRDVGADAPAWALVDADAPASEPVLDRAALNEAMRDWLADRPAGYGASAPFWQRPERPTHPGSLAS